MTKLEIKKLNKSFLNCFKKLKIGETKNVYVTSNLVKFAKTRIPKKKKVEIIYNNLKKIMGPKHSIFVPTSTLNLCNKHIVFDLKKTPSYKMGPFAEYIRLKKSIRSYHPFWSISGIGKNSRILRNVSKHAYGYNSPWSKMLELNFTQLNIGMHPSKAVTLIHHIETIMGVPYRFNKKFIHPVKKGKKNIKDEFFQTVFFKNTNAKKKILLNEHFFKILKLKKLLRYAKHPTGLEMWSFKMRDFFNIATKMFTKDIYTYLEKKPNLNRLSKL